jgi:hypothetical protein
LPSTGETEFNKAPFPFQCCNPVKTPLLVEVKPNASREKFILCEFEYGKIEDYDLK